MIEKVIADGGEVFFYDPASSTSTSESRPCSATEDVMYGCRRGVHADGPAIAPGGGVGDRRRTTATRKPTGRNPEKTHSYPRNT